MFANVFSGNALNSGPVGQLIELGGPVMGVLLFMALAGVITFVYLMLYGALFAPRYPRRLRQSVHNWRQAPDQSALERLQSDHRGFSRLNPLHRLLLGTMEGRLRAEPVDRIREAISQRAQQALAPFEAPLKIIEVIAALAPLLGLLGTVIGMMEAFNVMAAAEGRASASQLSGGIYKALATTAAGLIVAIPFAALAAWIEFRLRRLQTTLNAALTDALLADPAASTSTEAEAGVPEPENKQPSADTERQGSQPVQSEDNWQGQRAANAVS
mgnify:CR=1 FL=1